MKRVWRGSLALVAVAGLAALGATRGVALFRLGTGQVVTPTYEVHRAPFVRRVTADGNLRAVKSDPVAAPLLDEGGFKLAWMVPDGSVVKKGDVVVRFDPTELEKKLKDGQSDRAAAEAKIEKERTETGALLRDRDRTVTLSEAELQKTRKFQSKDTLIFSRNQIIESQVDEQLSTDRKSHAERAQTIESSLSKSKLDLLGLEQRKADIAIGRANKGLSGMEVTAVHDGIIVFEADGAGNLPKVGDTVWSGQRLASLPLLDEMEVEAFVLEADAGGLAPGQPASVVLEADPSAVYEGTIKAVDSLAKPRIRDVPINYFSVTISLAHTDTARMKPGQRASVTLMLDRQDALAVPRQAVFEKEGRKVVFRQAGLALPLSSFEELPVTLGASSPGLVVVEAGLAEGDRIALRDPTRPAEPASGDVSGSKAVP